MKFEKICFLIAAGISFFGAIIHWIAPFVGVDWYMFLTSPQWVVTSAKAQTWQAPAGAAGVGGLMFLCGVYACAGAGLTKRIPLSRCALCTISLICIVRGALIVPLLIKIPERLSAFDITASFVWLIAGICFAVGTVSRWNVMRPQ
ncbi:hypothetical protein H8K35_13725 [Undibacterium sp. LX40W]|uniref:Uncharacterized protein n=1 Tax=Undibacterium nitidum TaxID=2762298 RepID=A0A923KM22_9BURK|nr:MULTISPECIES: hypothetical protein [Undibacterium]MBC3882450.1 hypothetical protein [Undibacterium nitidum]MBC3892731.1 hypothetical protein [Undibacterium sp. LX40W]